MSKKKWLTVKETAWEIGVTEGHVYKLVRSGELAAIDISCSNNGGSNTIRVGRGSIEEFIERRVINPEDYYNRGD